MKTVLILTYYWPPSAGSGVQRWLKFAKYLPEFGWKPVIITPRDGTAPYYDQGLLADVPPEAEIIHTGTLEPFALYNALQGKKKDAAIPVGMIGLTEKKGIFHRFSSYLRANLFVPDARRGWMPYARRAALERIAQGGIDAFVTTGPPHSTHLAGLDIQRRTGLPWLADLRDPWTNIYYNRTLPRTAATEAKDRAWETQVVQAASAVTVVSPGMADEFAPRARRLEIIYNGYDSDDLPAHRPQPWPEFSLSHVGNFFPSLESPGLTQALVQLVAQEPGFARDFRLRCTGLLDPEVEARWRAAGLGEYLITHPPVSHAEAVVEMMRASMLLFSIANEGNVRALVSGKIFEYLATGLPILALGSNESGAAEVLRQSGSGSMLPQDDAEGIRQSIVTAYHAWLANSRQPIAADTAGGERYSRRSLTGEMATLLGEITR